MASNLIAVPQQPSGVRSKNVITDKTEQFVLAGSSSSVAQQKILAMSIDDVETEISFRAYDNMERSDPIILKAKRILLTNVLSDDLQMAPGATEAQVSEDEYKKYTAVMEFCERMVCGLDAPYRATMEQHYGNALKYGHGIAEVEWEYREDSPTEKPKDTEKKGRLSSFAERFKLLFKGQQTVSAADETKTKYSSLTAKKTRLMPKSIKVKPRNSTRFVVDDYMNTLGLIPVNRSKNLKPDDIIDRDKFMILTLNKKDEDPRGNSTYRPAINWYNLNTQIPAELMRYILEEAVPKAVATLPEHAKPFEFERDPETGDIIYNDPDTRKDPKMLTMAEAFKQQIEGFRGGSGAVIPFGAKLEPYKKGMTGASDADMWSKIIRVIKTMMEESILLQSLAQSEGEHQSRSASEQVAEVLYNLIFWTKWQLAMVTLYDLLTVGVKINLGDWAVQYLPLVSFGDFVRRDWVQELEALADAYFKGLLDDTQRPEIMSWLNLPKPGPSRQEQNLEAAAKQDVNGQPVQPNNNRPDKQTGTKNRNANNGREKKSNAKTASAIGSGGPLNSVGHNTGWFGRFNRNS